jgi:hypothetical protein
LAAAGCAAATTAAADTTVDGVDGAAVTAASAGVVDDDDDDFPEPLPAPLVPPAALPAAVAVSDCGVGLDGSTLRASLLGAASGLPPSGAAGRVDTAWSNDDDDDVPAVVEFVGTTVDVGAEPTPPPAMAGSFFLRDDAPVAAVVDIASFASAPVGAAGPSAATTAAAGVAGTSAAGTTRPA